MPLYFAYGSNMDTAAMARRCPGARGLGPARLNRHRLVIMREGYASVLRDPRRAVHGLLWDLPFSDVPALDRYEGVAGGLYVKAVQAVSTAPGLRRALIYLGRGGEGGVPRPGYLDGVLAAARALGLPAAYLREVAALAAVGGGGAAGKERAVSDARTARLTIRGRVQGVGYRAWTAAEAARRGLSGWVRNRRDGTVEALLHGPADAVAAMVAACRQGPRSARVTAVEEAEAAGEAPVPGFEQRPTL